MGGPIPDEGKYSDRIPVLPDRGYVIPRSFADRYGQGLLETVNQLIGRAQTDTSSGN